MGGDFNADMRIGENDSLGRILKENLIEEMGLQMTIEEFTHQEIRQGRLCRERHIDHIYTNMTNKITGSKATEIAGLNH